MKETKREKSKEELTEEKKIVNAPINQYLWKFENQINEAKQYRRYVEMPRRAKIAITSYYPKQKKKKCRGLKEYFESHFNHDQAKLMMPAEIEYKSISKHKEQRIL